MTLIIFDGFDAGQGGIMWNEAGGAGCWDNDSNIGGQGSSRFGRGFGNSLGSSSFIKKTIGFNASEIIVGDPILWSAGALTAFETIQFWDVTTAQATITHELDGSICLRRGSKTGTIVSQTPAGVSTTGSYHAFAYRVKFHGSTGQFQIWKDGASIWNVSGLNTIATANAYTTKFWIGNSGVGGSMTHDDVYAITVDGTAPNTFPGDATVYTLFPSGAGSSTQWTPLSGTNFSMVNESNGGEDSNYVSDPTAGHLDEYTLDDMPSGFLGTIIAVMGNIRVRKDDAGVRQVCCE